MNDALTLGVVGHVDHGKTALVRALTGIETDRHKEERERGLSIVLGFAFIGTDSGVVDLIDVPGHEDFIRAMISGATALDGIVLCVAANEGVMPQTVEHFNIARLLGIEKGFAVITKTDLVDVEELALAREDLDTFLRDTFLEGAPVVEVSALSGAGMDDIRGALADIAAKPVERDDRGRFFLPLDRVFTMKGFGLVVTGTLRGGELSVGDTVEIVPSGRSATVRALQNHNQAVERAGPGQRVAVNLRHVDRDEVKRGDVLASPDFLVPTSRIDVELHLLDDAVSAVKNDTVVRFLTGTKEAIAKLRLLDRRELAPGETSMVQLNLDREIATQPSEHYLVRSYSPMHTIGGGRILEVNTKRHRRFDVAITERLETVASGDLELVVNQRLQESGAQGVDLASLADELGVGHEELEEAVGQVDAVGLGKDLVVASGAYATVLTEIVTAIESFHEKHPFKNGLDTGSLTNELGSQPSPEVVRRALKELIDEKKIQSTHDVLSIAGYDPFAGLGESDRRLVSKIEQTFLDYGLEPPSPKAIVQGDKASQAVYRLLLEAGRLVRLKTYKSSSDLVLHASVLEDAKRAIERKFPYPAAFALREIRDLLGSTRKYIVPLMEHLDATGTTARKGDLRRLREQ